MCGPSASGSKGVSLHFYLLTQAPPAADTHRWLRGRAGQAWNEFLSGLSCQMSRGTPHGGSGDGRGGLRSFPVGALMKPVRITSTSPDLGGSLHHCYPWSTRTRVWSVFREACYQSRQSAKTKVLTECTLDNQDFSKVTR